MLKTESEVNLFAQIVLGVFSPQFKFKRLQDPKELITIAYKWIKVSHT